LNEYQCGSYKEHSLEEAHQIARDVLAKGIGVNRNEDLALDEKLLNP
ncbi:S-ribosylhomocysteine lyase, partial [Xanthomonas citri pv. citri]|nr:S-ribosylhomocysteine lyase [Xanthomonas citri pv. citri]